MAFLGPHHLQKILGKNHQSTTKVTLNKPPINKRTLTSQLYLLKLAQSKGLHVVLKRIYRIIEG